MTPSAALPLDQTVIRLTLLARLLDELAKRGYLRDLVADDPETPYIALDNRDLDFETSAGEILVTWSVSVAALSARRGERTEYWYAVTRRVVLDDGSEHSDTRSLPFPVARCQRPRKAARLIDAQVTSGLLGSPIYGRWWLWRHGLSGPLRLHLHRFATETAQSARRVLGAEPPGD